MDIKVKKTDFLGTLSFTQSVVERRSTMPILANVLIKASGKAIELNATDLEVGVSVVCPADVVKGGSVTVFARGIFDIVKELPDELIHLKTMENEWLSIDCGKTHFKVAGMGAGEFPAIPTGKEGGVYVEGGDSFLEMIEKTSFAMSSDETRYNLNGIYMQSTDDRGKDGIRIVATDGHRLAMIERPSKSRWKMGKGVIIPRKGVMELKKVLDAYEGEFSFKISEKIISVEKENTRLAIRVIDGQFPPYEQVIPKGNNKVAAVKKEELVMALRRVSLVAGEKTKGVRIKLSPGHLEVSTVNPDYGEASEEIGVKYKGDTFSVGFNARYLLDVFGVLEDEEVLLELKDDVSPCLIRSEFDKELVNVIMPMRM